MSKRAINFDLSPSAKKVIDELSEEAYQAVLFDAGRAYQIGIFSFKFNLPQIYIKEWKEQMKQTDTGHGFYKNDEIVALLHSIYKEGYVSSLTFSR